jgi:hypothetical protein
VLPGALETINDFDQQEIIDLANTLTTDC